MKIDLYAASGTKQGSMELPATLFEAPINRGLIHLALIRQQSNRRHPVAHAKKRSEVRGSTRKLFQQKGTGRARRGSVRSPLLRGGGKAFGPKKDANFQKDMPKQMRRAALFSCLSLRAKDGIIVGLESYPDDIKTKAFAAMLKKMALPIGRKIVVVTAEAHRGVALSARNVPGVKTLTAGYLNPEDLMQARSIIFFKDAVAKAEEIFGKKTMKNDKKEKVEKNKKNVTGEKKRTKQKNETAIVKKPSKSSVSSVSSASSDSSK